ncbi:MAG: hypothetical protein DI551_01255 [Micavibrio aeruginosavorus]|uniref:Phosphoribosyltransferase n=1 Tax=Micavibrio aeruginosavorus TaxID=349221 RepID=A0A2W5N5C6_9BACT|nr:MAG: hypothetical protein DI551_01255 [Micavibrio aeruginosavorus]
MCEIEVRHTFNDKGLKVLTASHYKQSWLRDKPVDEALKRTPGLSDHPSYWGAKYGGDKDSAIRVVRDSIDHLQLARMAMEVKAIEAEYGQKPIIVAPYKEHSKNKLARAAAVHLGRELGLEVDTSVIEISQMSRKTFSKMERALCAAAEFEGVSKKGAPHILIDDNMLSGSTLADLRGHLMDNGSDVVLGMVLSTPDGQDLQLNPSQRQIQSVESNFSTYIRKWIGSKINGGIESLTSLEADIFSKPGARRELLSLITPTAR